MRKTELNYFKLSRDLFLQLLHGNMKLSIFCLKKVYSSLISILKKHSAMNNTNIILRHGKHSLKAQNTHTFFLLLQVFHTVLSSHDVSFLLCTS